MRFSTMMSSTSLAFLLVALGSIALTHGFPQSVRQRRDVHVDATAADVPEPEQADVADVADDESTRNGRALGSSRVEKALEFYDYLRPPYYEIENEVLSRAEPSRNNYPDSPIYYIRLPPTPYMFVPGLGYVSPPPQRPPMNPFINLPLDFVANGKPTNIYQWSAPNGDNNYNQKPVSKPNVNFVSNGKPTSIYRPKPETFGNQGYRPQYRPQSEYNVDFVANGKPIGLYSPDFDSQTQAALDFVANGKPTNMFRPSYEDSIAPDDSPIYRPIYEAPRPKPVSNVINMNKGPYMFNGRPTDMYLLRNSYNALYEDALQNFYP